MLEQIRGELEDGHFQLQAVPFEAVRKLRFVGGWAAADTLVDALGNLRGLQKEAERSLAQCMQPSVYTGLNPTPQQKEATRTYCENLRYFRHIDEMNAAILRTLAQIVKNPPLPADAAATPENFRKWKTWWNENQDRASFIPQRPQQSFE
jgi:hypothetical protein